MVNETDWDHATTTSFCSSIENLRLILSNVMNNLEYIKKGWFRCYNIEDGTSIEKKGISNAVLYSSTTAAF